MSERRPHATTISRHTHTRERDEGEEGDEGSMSAQSAYSVQSADLVGRRVTCDAITRHRAQHAGLGGHSDERGDPASPHVRAVGPPSRQKRTALPRASRASCAVVSSSGLLKGSQCGPRVDRHDLIFRCNNAPVAGYENDVGRAPDVMLMQRVIDILAASEPTRSTRRLVHSSSSARELLWSAGWWPGAPTARGCSTL